MLELNDEVIIINNYYGAEEYKKQFIGHRGKIVNIYDDGNRFFYTVEGINYVWQNFNLKLIKKESDIKMSKKEQLLNKLEQIKKDFIEKIENVKTQIEEEDNKKEYLNPKYGEKYYTITETSINQYEWTNEAFDGRCLDELNCFKTREEAERQAFEQLLHRKLQQFAILNNCLRIEWKNRNKGYGQVYFSSMDIANQAIYKFGDDLYKYFES